MTGHYGSGKTNLSVNLALECKKRGEDVALADLDIVNPYFCTAEYARPLERRGIDLIAPLYAGSNLDVPALTARLGGEIASGRRLIIDAGGDDVGARALGRYSRAIEEAGGCEMLYVVNARRFLTETPEEAAGLLRQIERASRLKATGIVNNTNLGAETTLETVTESMAFAEETARRTGLPLLFTAARLDRPEQFPGKLFPVEIVVRKPWETPFS